MGDGPLLSTVQLRHQAVMSTALNGASCAPPLWTLTPREQKKNHTHEQAQPTNTQKMQTPYALTNKTTTSSSTQGMLQPTTWTGNKQTASFHDPSHARMHGKLPNFGLHLNRKAQFDVKGVKKGPFSSTSGGRGYRDGDSEVAPSGPAATQRRAPLACGSGGCRSS